jgi:hypothetical protein
VATFVNAPQAGPLHCRTRPGRGAAGPQDGCGWVVGTVVRERTSVTE